MTHQDREHLKRLLAMNFDFLSVYYKAAEEYIHVDISSKKSREAEAIRDKYAKTDKKSPAHRNMIRDDDTRVNKTSNQKNGHTKNGYEPRVATRGQNKQKEAYLYMQEEVP